MKSGQFTPRAALLWSAIPSAKRELLLANVFCVRCRGSVTIVDFTGEEQHGDVILRGVCAQCGHKVARVVETSEVDHSGN
jgi:hypothetical protein